MTIHTELKQAGIEIYHGECSLVVKDCPTARAILANHGLKSDNYFTLPNGQAWFDIPSSMDYIPECDQ